MAEVEKRADGGFTVHIPATDAYFDAKTEEDVKRKGNAMVKSFVQFWKEENENGVLGKK